MFLTIDCISEQSALDHSCEITGSTILGSIVLVNQFQSLTQLQHRSKFMLTIITAKAVAGQMADFSIIILKFYHLGDCTLYNGIATVLVNRNVPNTILNVVVLASVGDLIADSHAL